MWQEQVIEKRNILTGLLFSLGGSVLFLIGTSIAIVIAYKSYTKELEQPY